jgi:uncharacterized protein YjbI with pentapeptide repeats
VHFTGAARFNKSAFSREARFDDASFTGSAWFDEVAFSGDAWFKGATFSGLAWFDEVAFSGDATFARADFSGEADFSEVAFSGTAEFSDATFSGLAWFGDATFSGQAKFHAVTFSGDAGFVDATFYREAWFKGATFSGDARFSEVVFHRRAMFEAARFEQTRQFGPVLAYRGLVLDGAEFAQPVQIEVSTTGLCCRRARFQGGAQLRVRSALVVLDDADFSAPSILTGIPRLSSDSLAQEEKQIARAWERLLAGEISEQPQLPSLIRANVTGLTLSNIAVTDCRFASAHNLDKMRLEGDIGLALAPSPLGRLSWEGRQVIAEERDWRAGRARPWGWLAPWWPSWLNNLNDRPAIHLNDRPATLDPDQIASLYRALRKGREDLKDEPGSADFYYGEMEMRRRARHTPGGESRGRAERGVLTAYWLVSGYGMRSWRAVAWLAAITFVFAVAFHFVGFVKPPQPVSLWTSLLYSFRATLSLTDSNVQLTAWGNCCKPCSASPGQYCSAWPC